MPKVCEPCGFYSAENAPSSCPKCGGGVRFTLLPPQGQAAEPLANVSADTNTAVAKARRQKEGFLDSLGVDPKVLGVIGLVLVGVIGVGIRQYQKKELVAQVQPGMHISEAAKLIDTGKGMHHPKMVRFRDRFAPDDTSSGSFTYQDNGIDLVVHWKNGIVTEVENRGTNPGGMRRRSTQITDDGDDDDDGE